jgi:hypothetical protein
LVEGTTIVVPPGAGLARPKLLCGFVAGDFLAARPSAACKNAALAAFHFGFFPGRRRNDSVSRQLAMASRIDFDRVTHLNEAKRPLVRPERFDLDHFQIPSNVSGPARKKTPVRFTLPIRTRRK